MQATISAQELRRKLPHVLRSLQRGRRYTIIYRSKPVGELQPIGGIDHDTRRRALLFFANPPKRYRIRSKKSAVRFVREARGTA